MQLQPLVRAGVPMGPLQVLVPMYRAGAGKYHGKATGCHATKSRLHYSPVVLTDIADDRYCWSCAHHPTEAEPEAYYVGAHAVLDAVAAAAKRLTSKKDPLTEVLAARAELATARRLLVVADHDSLTAWAAPHLTDLQTALTALEQATPAASDPQLAIRTVVLADLDGTVPLDPNTRARSRTLPDYPADSFPALCANAERWNSVRPTGQGDIVTTIWTALVEAYRADGDLELAQKRATTAGQEKLAALPGPVYLAQVPTHTLVATSTCGTTLAAAVDAAWRAAAEGEVIALAAALRTLVQAAQERVESSPMRVVALHDWRPDRAERVRDAAPLLTTWPLHTNAATGLALTRMPHAALSWLQTRGVLPGPSRAGAVAVLDLGDSPDTDGPDVFTVAHTLLEPNVRPGTPSHRVKDALRPALELARAATA